MSLLIGTDDGLYRADDIPFAADEVEEVLDCGRVTDVADIEYAEGVFTATDDGAFRSFDGGESWERLEVPAGDRYWVAGDDTVMSLHAAPDGTLFAGTNQPAIYRSYDDGASWHELRGLHDLPSRSHWESPGDPKRARIRNIESVPNAKDRLVIAVEVGGVHLSEDGGDTWIDRGEHVPDDVHHVLPLTADCWLAATGYFDLELEHVGLQTGLGHATGWGGLHRTTDAGRTWQRLDVGNEYAYIRRAHTHDGTVFFCGSTGAPPAWEHGEHETALFESTDFGRTFEQVPFPGAPDEVIEDWVVRAGDLLCGSGVYDIPHPRDDIDGRIMRRNGDGTYETVGTVSASVGRLEVISG